MRIIEQIRLFRLNARRRSQDRQFSRDARRYLHEVVSHKYEAENFKAISDLYKRKVFKATAKGGRNISIKLYRGKQAKFAKRLIALQPVIEAAGIVVPKLIGSDVSPEAMSDFGLASVVSEWIDGEQLTPGAEESSSQAMRLLRRLHHVEDQEPELKSRISDGVPLDFDAAIDAAREKLEMLNRIYFHIDPADRQRVFDLVQESFEALKKTDKARIGLIHLDFSPQNLLLSGGEVCMLDFEEVVPGANMLDLSLAILHLGFGFGSEALDKVAVSDIIESQPWRELETAYYIDAMADDLALWRAHRWPCLVWAYLWMIANVAKKSTNPHRYSSDERKYYGRWAKRHWKRLAESVS